MDPRDLSDDQLDQLAQQLAGRLPTGTHGDRVVLSRRQFALAASGVLSAGALTALGVDEASAQAAGQVGTASEPVDAFVYDLDVANAVTSSLPMGGNDIENAGSVSIDSVDITNPTKIGVVETWGEAQAIGSSRFTLTDDEKEVVSKGSEFGAATIFGVRNRSDNTGVVAVVAGTSVNLLISNTGWSSSDTDGNSCIFNDANGDLVLKNRTGGSREYEAWALNAQ